MQDTINLTVRRLLVAQKADVRVPLRRHWTRAKVQYALAVLCLHGGATMPRSFLYLFVLLAAALAAGVATAADIKVMISAGFFNVYADLGPAFEKLTGHKLITTRGPSVGDSPEAIPTRLTRGEGADVVIMDGTGVDLLDQRGMTRPGSRMPLAESFIGMVVSSGSAQARHQHGRGDAKDTPRREIHRLFG
jgi:ABC-type molybdate transport system substrate-binding protein